MPSWTFAMVSHGWKWLTHKMGLRLGDRPRIDCVADTVEATPEAVMLAAPDTLPRFCEGAAILGEETGPDAAKVPMNYWPSVAKRRNF